MGQKTIDQLIVSSPYEEPTRHWRYDRETRSFDLVEGRRPAGYIVASGDSRTFDDPGIFSPIPLVNRIRARVQDWRNAGHPGVSGVTRRLLRHWTDAEEFGNRRFFFCQIEAAETLIWLTECADVDKAGLDIPSDGGAFRRLCAKMATGSGKTIVMAMVAAWQILNKVAHAGDARFSRHVLVVAPGLTVKNRLVVLDPAHPDNYYEAFGIVPTPLLDKLRRGRLVVQNWHALNWETEEKIAGRRGVDKRGAKSDEAYVRDVLGDMARARNILVLNDEAHHAWRVPAVAGVAGVAKASIKEAAKWIGGLDRIHRARGIAVCYDFSATPFAPSGRQSSEEALFGWIVSDFGLSDAIESGLVKTPRVVIRDDALPDAKSYRSRLYHLYNDPEVKDDLGRKARPEEPLPSLVTNAYCLLGFDWRETARKWEACEVDAPPVMITVANRTETAARIKHAFDGGRIPVDELCDPERTLHIDSGVLAKAEASEAEEPAAPVEGKMTNKQRAEWLRLQVDTIGRREKPGWRIQNVISVGMLSEGWDARNVTHIMGLRAFGSQLLCEQVVGRGLRRISYDVNPTTGFFEPEYVNIFGVPFAFLPHEGSEGAPPPPPSPKTVVEPVAERERFAISWPNIERIDRVFRPRLSLSWEALTPLQLDASQIIGQTELAPIVDGKPDTTQIDAIELEKLAKHRGRLQRIVFVAAGEAYAAMQPAWQGSRPDLLGQLVRLMEQFVRWKGLTIVPAAFNRDGWRRHLVLSLHMTELFQHFWSAIRFDDANAEILQPVFDRDRPIRFTGDMQAWYTGKPCAPTMRSHINFCVYDSTWEDTAAFVLDRAPEVAAWVKNDHLGFEVLYRAQGSVRKYRPDFLIRLSSGGMLVLEMKGRIREHDETKHRFLNEWIGAVNAHGGFGRWSWDVSRNPAGVRDILAKHAKRNAG